MSVKKWCRDDAKGGGGNITDMLENKPLQFCQTEKCFVFSNEHMFRSNNTVVIPPLKNCNNIAQIRANCACYVDRT
jgi:hypothetical protein